MAFAGHVNHHIHGGMTSLFVVQPQPMPLMMMLSSPAGKRKLSLRLCFVGFVVVIVATSVLLIFVHVLAGWTWAVLAFAIATPMLVFGGLLLRVSFILHSHFGLLVRYF